MYKSIDEYLLYLESISKKEKDRKNTYYSLRLFADFMYSHDIHDVKKLKVSHVHTWQLHQRERVTADGLPLMPNTINNNLAKLKNFLAYLYKRERIKLRLYEHIEFLKLPQLLPTSLLSDTEMNALLGTFDVSTTIGFRNKTITSLLYSSGLRVSELCQMNIESVKLAEGTALIYGKGDKERLVPIGLSALKLLESYVKAIRPLFMKSKQRDCLFYTYRGSRITVAAIQLMIKEASEKAGFTGITPHSMRRSFATEMIKANANLYHVKEIMGHEDLRHLKRYVKLNIVDLKKTHKKFHPRG